MKIMLAIQKLFRYLKSSNLAICVRLWKRDGISEKKMLKPTGFVVKSQYRDKVKLKCDYNPSIWIRRFEYRKVIRNGESQGIVEWISQSVPGSRTIDVISDLECGEEYIFRIVHIGRDNELVFSDEVNYFKHPIGMDGVQNCVMTYAGQQ